MLAYLASTWRCRYFWMSLVKNDLQLRYRRSFLGVGWSLLQPLATAIVTCAVFHAIFKQDIRQHGLFILSGLACWSYVTSSVIQGCQSYVQAESYIRQHPMPMAIYPLRTTLGSMIHFLIALGLVTTLTWVLNGFGNVRTLWALIPALILYFQFGWAVATLTSYVNTVFRDTQHFFEIGFPILFYLTPIIYSPENVATTPVGFLVANNPLVPFLNMIRRPLLHGDLPSAFCYASAFGMTALVTLLAALSLRYQQRRVILYL
jgi:lipopolysaccharide transport system permease protein